MANMNKRGKPSRVFSEREKDRIVVAQAEDGSAWGKPVRVRPREPTSISIPADLAARAAFLARLHRSASVAAWLRHVIKERVEVEEAAFAGAKHELAARERD